MAWHSHAGADAGASSWGERGRLALTAPAQLIGTAQEEIPVWILLPHTQQVPQPLLHLLLHMAVQLLAALPVAGQGGRGGDGLAEDEVDALGDIEGDDGLRW